MQHFLVTSNLVKSVFGPVFITRLYTILLLVLAVQQLWFIGLYEKLKIMKDYEKLKIMKDYKKLKLRKLIFSLVDCGTKCHCCLLGSLSESGIVVICTVIIPSGSGLYIIQLREREGSQGGDYKVPNCNI